MELKKGFYPALGTPLDPNGELVEESFVKQIEAMIAAGASGMLCMGSMGTEAALTDAVYEKTAKVAAETVRGRVPLFIGAMDNSVFRVRDRFAALAGLEFYGVVLTTPFYQKNGEAHLIRYFKEAADLAPRPLFLYDLPVVTKQKITYPMAKELARHPNIRGIKTGDPVLARLLLRHVPEMQVLFSNLDLFDVACAYGLPRVLDGMFACTPKNASALQKAYEAGDAAGVGAALDHILALRDLMAENGIWPGFTVAMNLLGFAGAYGTGYGSSELKPEESARIEAMMRKIGEIS